MLIKQSWESSFFLQHPLKSSIVYDSHQYSCMVQMEVLQEPQEFYLNPDSQKSLIFWKWQ